MKKKKLIFCLIGESGSGKSTIAQYMADTYNWNIVKSYTTRKKRFEEENDHVFVSQEVFADILKTNEIVAYTEFDENKYCATFLQLLNSDIYIIDPKGWENRKEYPNIEYFPIYIDVPEEVRIKRMTSRGDSEEDIVRRIEHDRIAFKDFKNTPSLVSMSGEKEQIAEELLTLKDFLISVKTELY